MAVTAKVKLTSKTDNGDGQVYLTFNADYEDGRNKEWSKYTPALTLNMYVKQEITDLFPTDQTYTLTFEKSD